MLSNNLKSGNTVHPKKGPIRKFLARSLLTFCIFLMLFIAIDIIQARQTTQRAVGQLLRSEKASLNILRIEEKRISVLLIVEDPKFFTHKGLDFSTPGAGWTTISQGLAKDIYFDSFQPGIAKIRLIYLTRFALHPKVSKQDQLALFFNYVHLGTDIFGNELKGFENAAQFYFNKGFAQLSNEEYISLVATVISPSHYRIDRFPEVNEERAYRIKRLIGGFCEPNGWLDCLLNGCK